MKNRAPDECGYLLPQLAARLFAQTLDRTMDFLQVNGYTDLRPTHILNVFLFLDIKGLRPGVLASKAHMTPQAMGELIDYLEERGYVRRQPDPDDRRAKLVVYDTRGFEAAPKLTGFFKSLEDEWSDKIGSDHLEQIRFNLGHLVSGNPITKSGST